MLINIALLNRFVDMPSDMDEIEEVLIRAGIEIEEAFIRAEQLNGVVIGEILTDAPIPNEPGFSVASVDIGSSTPINIVHGNAFEIKPGMRVPVAPAGVELPNVKVVESIVRGVKSQGMICPDRDLGIIATGSGLQTFRDTVSPGTKLVSVSKPDDIILNVSITSNRGDMISHLGVAREICAVTGWTLTEPERIPDIDSLPSGDIHISIEDPSLCSQYIGTVVENVKVIPSPEWMATALISVGLRSINNLVDLTNYVMIECGNPLHAFDLKLLKGGVRIGPAKSGDKIKILDSDKETQPAVGSPLILDDHGPIAIAGVIGGADYSIKPDTTSLFLEAALFNPVAVRRSARSAGLRTDSSYRFERGVVKDSVEPAVRRALYLLEMMLPDCKIKGVNLAIAPLDEELSIPVRPDRALRDIGVELLDNDIEDIVTRFNWTDEGRGNWRPDRRRYYIDEPLDAMEDIARGIGYDAIEYMAPTKTENNLPKNAAREFQRRVVASMAGAGFQEAVTLSLVPESFCGLFELVDDEPIIPVKVLNPISEEYGFVRDSIAASLVDRARYNASQGIKSLRLFELASEYKADSSSETGATYRVVLGAVGYGLRIPGDWKAGETIMSLQDFAGSVLNSALSGLITGELTLVPKALKGLDPAESAQILLNGKVIGGCGRISAEIQKTMHAPDGLFVLELDVEKLSACQWKYKPVNVPSRQPHLLRDLSIVLSAGTKYSDVETTIRANAGANLDALRLYDLYTGKQVTGDRFSLTFSLSFRAPDRALTDDEINPLMETMISKLKDKHQAELRM